MAIDEDYDCVTENLIGLPTEKKQKIDDSDGSPPTDANLDVEYESDDSDDSGFMTMAEFEPYKKMVDETDGYYVPELEWGRCLWGNYIRQERRLDSDQDIIQGAQYAIEYNKTNKTETEKKNLKFLKVTNCTSQLSGDITFYITFEAEDEDTGEVATYQTRISEPIGGGDIIVEQFRLKPLGTNYE